MKYFARSVQHDRSTCFDRLPRCEHNALFERARGRGSGRAAQEWWWSVGRLTGLRCLAAGRPLHPICPRSVQGKWELEGDNRRFRPRGARGRSPAPTMGGPPEGRRDPSESRDRGRRRKAAPPPPRSQGAGLFCAGLAPLLPLRGGNRSDAAVPSPRPSLRWLRSEANPLPRSAPDLAVGARNGIRPTA